MSLASFITMMMIVGATGFLMFLAVKHLDKHDNDND